MLVSFNHFFYYFVLDRLQLKLVLLESDLENLYPPHTQRSARHIVGITTQRTAQFLKYRVRFVSDLVYIHVLCILF